MIFSIGFFPSKIVSDRTSKYWSEPKFDRSYRTRTRRHLMRTVLRTYSLKQRCLWHENQFKTLTIFHRITNGSCSFTFDDVPPNVPTGGQSVFLTVIILRALVSSPVPPGALTLQSAPPNGRYMSLHAIEGLEILIRSERKWRRFGFPLQSVSLVESVTVALLHPVKITWNCRVCPQLQRASIRDGSARVRNANVNKITINKQRVNTRGVVTRKRQGGSAVSAAV